MQTQQIPVSVSQEADRKPDAPETDQISSLYVTEDKVDELHRVEKLLISELQSELAKGEDEVSMVTL